MADLFNKHIKKATSRTKEKLLEGIGKGKATQDEAFDGHAANLHKQAKSCERLHKDIKTYISALKVLCDAEKALRDTIRDGYEPEWPEREHFTALLDNLDIQTNSLEAAMGDGLLQSVSTYCSQFHDLKKKVDKRGRKLVDYDHAKRNFNSLKASSKKVESDPKVAKAQIELQDTEKMYTELNNELLEILPAVYDSRITFFVDTLQTMFNAHSIHDGEAVKINKQVVTQLDKLGEAMDELRVPRPEPRALTPIDTTPDSTSIKSSNSPSNSIVPPSVTPQPTTPTPPERTTAVAAPESTNPFGDDEEVEEEACSNKVYPKLNAAAPPPSSSAATDKTTVPTPEKREKDPNNPFDESEDETPVEETPISTKPSRKVLYRVVSTHEYKAVDTDELSFGPGIEIKVLESMPADQLDDGWQMGELPNGSRGVFPLNFTKKREGQ